MEPCTILFCIKLYCILSYYKISYYIVRWLWGKVILSSSLSNSCRLPSSPSSLSPVCRPSWRTLPTDCKSNTWTSVCFSPWLPVSWLPVPVAVCLRSEEACWSCSSVPSTSTLLWSMWPRSTACGSTCWPPSSPWRTWHSWDIWYVSMQLFVLMIHDHLWTWNLLNQNPT